MNKITWGYRKGEVSVIAGRTSTGKTSLAIQDAYLLAKLGKIVLFCSMEHSKGSIVERLICNEYSFNSEELRSAGATDRLMARQEEIVKDLTKLPLLIQDDIGRDAEELIKFLPRIQPQPDIIFIDHLQQISTRKYGGNLTIAIQEYMHIIKDLALAKNYAMVVISQLSRNVSDGTDDGGRARPSLKDLKWSGAIEEISDVVSLLWYPDNEQGMSIIVAKQRNGPLGCVKAKFFPKHFRFEDVKELTKVYNKGDSRRYGDDL